MEMNRRRFLQGLAALTQAGSIGDSATDWLEAVATAPAGAVLSPSLALRTVWQHMLLIGNVVGKSEQNDLRKLIPPDILAQIPQRYEMSQLNSLGNIIELLSEGVRKGDSADELDMQSEDWLGKPMPKDAASMQEMVEQAVRWRHAWCRQMQAVAAITRQHPEAIAQAWKQLPEECHHWIFESSKTSWHMREGALNIMTASPQEVRTFFAKTLQLETTEAFYALSRAIGPRPENLNRVHADEWWIEQEDVEKLKQELADPNWRSIFDRDPVRLAQQKQEQPMQPASTIHIITTGGTIESFYNPEHGTPSRVPVGERSCIPAALERLGYLDGYVHEPLFLRDSNEFSDADCERMYRAIIDSPLQRVLVVHGTDTMPVHAQELQRRIDLLPPDHPAHQKTVLFTGGMGPLRDAQGVWRNQARAWEVLDKAMDGVREQAAGVWLEMGMGAWRAGDVAKYKTTIQREGREIVEASGFTLKGEKVTLPPEERGR